MDQRDSPTWVVLELNHLGENKVEDGTLEESLRRDLDPDKRLAIFIPARTYRKGTRSTTVQLMQGYAFIEAGFDEVDYFALEKRPYISHVLSIKNEKGMRVLQVLHDDRIQELRRKLQKEVSSDLVAGNYVRILEGEYSRLEGGILEIEDDVATVFIRLRSLEIVVSVPTVFLEAVEGAQGCAVCFGLENNAGTCGGASRGLTSAQTCTMIDTMEYSEVKPTEALKT